MISLQRGLNCHMKLTIHCRCLFKILFSKLIFFYYNLVLLDPFYTFSYFTNYYVFTRELKSCKSKMDSQSKQVAEYSSRLDEYDKKFEENSRKFGTLLTV
jgi:hypothetical protein